MESRNFLENYQVTDIEKDPLPIKVLRNAITKDEIPGQAVHWGFDYLDQRLCPLPLISHILEKLYQEVHETNFSQCVEAAEDTLDGNGGGEYELRYEPLKLMRAIVKKLDEICLKEKEDFHDSVDGEVESPDMQPHVHAVSYNNIKNSRRFMEDRMTILPRMDRLFKLPSPISYFAVFDGHNGAEAAAYGAAQLHQYLIESLKQHQDVIPSISDAFESLDEVFNEKCRTGKVKSGSTVVLSLIMPEKLYVAWLGDSQAVLVKRNEVNNLVTPHKPERKDEIERIRSLGGEVIHMHDTYRVNGNLAVSRAIGDADQKTFIISTPDIKMLELDGSEEFLILACDGLWDEISPEAAAKIVRRQIVSDHSNVSGISQKLIQQAKQRGSQDNISVIVVFLEPVESIRNRYKDVLEPEAEIEITAIKQSPEPVDAMTMEKFIEHGVEPNRPVLSEMNGHSKEEQLVDFLSFGSSKESGTQMIGDEGGNQSGDEDVVKKEVEEVLSDAESDDEWQFEKPSSQAAHLNESPMWKQEQQHVETLDKYEHEPLIDNLVDNSTSVSGDALCGYIQSSQSIIDTATSVSGEGLGNYAQSSESYIDTATSISGDVLGLYTQSSPTIADTPASVSGDIFGVQSSLSMIDTATSVSGDVLGLYTQSNIDEVSSDLDATLRAIPDTVSDPDTPRTTSDIVSNPETPRAIPDTVSDSDTSRTFPDCVSNPDTPRAIPDMISDDEGFQNQQQDNTRPESAQSRDSFQILKPATDLSAESTDEFTIAGNTNPFITEASATVPEGSHLIVDVDAEQKLDNDKLFFGQPVNAEGIFLGGTEPKSSGLEGFTEPNVASNIESSESIFAQSTESDDRRKTPVDLIGESAKDVEPTASFSASWSTANSGAPVAVNNDDLINTVTEESVGGITLDHLNQGVVIQPVTLFEEFEEDKSNLVPESVSKSAHTIMSEEVLAEQNSEIRKMESNVIMDNTVFIEKFEEEPLIDTGAEFLSDHAEHLIETPVDIKESQQLVDAVEERRPDSAECKDSVQILMAAKNIEIESPIESHEYLPSGNTNPFAAVNSDAATTITSLISDETIPQAIETSQLQSVAQISPETTTEKNLEEQEIPVVEESTQTSIVSNNEIDESASRPDSAGVIEPASDAKNAENDLKPVVDGGSFDNNWNVVPVAPEAPLVMEKQQTMDEDNKEEVGVLEQQPVVSEVNQSLDVAVEPDRHEIIPSPNEAVVESSVNESVDVASESVLNAVNQSLSTAQEPTLNGDVKMNDGILISENLPKTLDLPVSKEAVTTTSNKAKTAGKPAPRTVKSPLKPDAPVTKGKVLLTPTLTHKSSPTKPEPPKASGLLNGKSAASALKSAPKSATNVAAKPTALKAPPSGTKTIGSSRMGTTSTVPSRSVAPKNANGIDAKVIGTAKPATSAALRMRPAAPAATKSAVSKTAVPSTTSPKKIPPVGTGTSARPPTASTTRATATSVAPKIGGDGASKPAGNLTRARPKPPTTTSTAGKLGAGADAKKTTVPKTTPLSAKPTTTTRPPVARTTPTHPSSTTGPAKPSSTATKPPMSRITPKTTTESSKPAVATLSKTAPRTGSASAARAPAATKKVESSLLKSKKPSAPVPGKGDSTIKPVKSNSVKKPTPATSEKAELIEQSSMSNNEANANVAELNVVNGGLNGDHNGMNGETEKQDAIKQNGVHLDNVSAEANSTTPTPSSAPIENLLG